MINILVVEDDNKLNKNKPPIDERVNVKSSMLNDTLLMFLILITVNAGYLMIFMSVFEITPTVENLLRIETISYTLFFSAILALITTRLRTTTLNRPMQRLSEAARKVAKGDFTARVEHIRKDGKKDYIAVMFDDFNTMAEELSSIETMKNDFIGNVSHEIKTPIAIILNYASALKQHNLSEEDRDEYAGTIAEAAQKLDALVTNILKLSKLENQGIVQKGTPFDLSDQLCSSALAFEDLWEKKDIHFTADIEDDVRVRCDESMLEIVWNNLISNAVKFTPNGGSISLTLKTEDDLAVITISDTGCGMDEITIRHIFDKFYQGDTSHSQEGNGLGLALVSRIIELLDGEIRVKSEADAGTNFTVLLKTE